MKLYSSVGIKIWLELEASWNDKITTDNYFHCHHNFSFFIFCSFFSYWKSIKNEIYWGTTPSSSCLLWWSLQFVPIRYFLIQLDAEKQSVQPFDRKKILDRCNVCLEQLVVRSWPEVPELGWIARRYSQGILSISSWIWNHYASISF